MKYFFAPVLLSLTAMLSCNSSPVQNSSIDTMSAPTDTSVSPMKITPDTVTASLPTADNSQTSVDWPGSYHGVLPCADCEGIETTIDLKSDKNYVITSKYLGKDGVPIVKKGKFEWDSSGSKIKLGAQQYKVGENRLFHLDQKGEMIKGELASKYVLEKLIAVALVSDGPIEGVYWKLTELLGKRVDTTVQRKQLHLQFEKDSDRVTGSGGCNNISGTYTAEASGKIILSKMISTRMACPAMQDESAFLQALSKVNTYVVSGNKLQLSAGRTAPLLVFEAAAKPQ